MASILTHGQTLTPDEEAAAAAMGSGTFDVLKYRASRGEPLYDEQRVGFSDVARFANALELRREGASTFQAPVSIDMSVPSPWNPTPTNYNPDPLGRTDLERQVAEIQAAGVAAGNPYEPPQHVIEQLAAQGTPYVSPAEVVQIATVLEERRSGTPIRAIDELGGSAVFTNDPPQVQTQEEPVSLLGSVVSGVGNFLSGGAKALLESRRDQPSTVQLMSYYDPPAVPGMPSWSPAQQASIIPSWGTLGSTIGKVAATVGTAVTAYQAGQAVLNQGGRGVMMGGVQPKSVSRKQLVCPIGYVLGADGNCYPKSMLPRGARKWKPDPKPVVSRADQKAIARAAAAKKRLVKLTNAAGAHATVTRPHRHTSSKKK